jgi:hypothetical protein
MTGGSPDHIELALRREQAGRLYGKSNYLQTSLAHKFTIWLMLEERSWPVARFSVRSRLIDQAVVLNACTNKTRLQMLYQKRLNDQKGSGQPNLEQN